MEGGGQTEGSSSKSDQGHLAAISYATELQFLFGLRSLCQCKSTGEERLY